MTDSDTELDNFEPSPEALDEGGTWLLDLVAAVDHLRRGLRPGITVWEALEEATTDPTAVADDAPVGPVDWDALQTPLRRWLAAMADRYNDGHHWPHPTARRSSPPPLLDIAALLDA